jgi:hypothetical protein
MFCSTDRNKGRTFQDCYNSDLEILAHSESVLRGRAVSFSNEISKLKYLSLRGDCQTTFDTVASLQDEDRR